MSSHDDEIMHYTISTSNVATININTTAAPLQQPRIFHLFSSKHPFYTSTNAFLNQTFHVGGSLQFDPLSGDAHGDFLLVKSSVYLVGWQDSLSGGTTSTTQQLVRMANNSNAVVGDDGHGWNVEIDSGGSFNKFHDSCPKPVYIQQCF